MTARGRVMRLANNWFLFFFSGPDIEFAPLWPSTAVTGMMVLFAFMALLL